MTMAQNEILFVGLGNMGGPMVANLAGEYGVTVYDANAEVTERVARELGVSGLTDLTSLADSITTVVLMLPNSVIVERVLLGTADEATVGMLHQLGAGVTIIDMGSSDPRSTRHLAEQAREKGIEYVDAPVSGGVAKAKTGELSIMVGAAPDAYARVLPMLERMGSAITYVGSSGSGHAAKAINNLLSASNLVSAAEALVTAKRFGIDPEKMLEVINKSTSRSQASEVKFPKHILPNAYDSGFYFELMLKDIKIAMSLVEEYDIKAPNLTTTHESAIEALTVLGRIGVTGGPLDHTELARYVEHINTQPGHDS